MRKWGFLLLTFITLSNIGWCQNRLSLSFYFQFGGEIFSPICELVIVLIFSSMVDVLYEIAVMLNNGQNFIKVCMLSWANLKLSCWLSLAPSQICSIFSWIMTCGCESYNMPLVSPVYYPRAGVFCAQIPIYSTLHIQKAQNKRKVCQYAFWVWDFVLKKRGFLLGGNP